MKSNERILLSETMTPFADSREGVLLDAIESTETMGVQGKDKKNLYAQSVSSILAAYATIRLSSFKDIEDIVKEHSSSPLHLEKRLIHLVHQLMDKSVCAGYVIGKYVPGNECFDSLVGQIRMDKQGRETKNPEFVERQRREKIAAVDESFKRLREQGIPEEWLQKSRKELGL